MYRNRKQLKQQQSYHRIRKIRLVLCKTTYNLQGYHLENLRFKRLNDRQTDSQSKLCPRGRQKIHLQKVFKLLIQKRSKRSLEQAEMVNRPHSDQCMCWLEDSKSLECSGSMYGLLPCWDSSSSPGNWLVRGCCEIWPRPRSGRIWCELLPAISPFIPQEVVGKWLTVPPWVTVDGSATGAPWAFIKDCSPRPDDDDRFLEPHGWFDRRERAQLESATTEMHSPGGGGIPWPAGILVPQAEVWK